MSLARMVDTVLIAVFILIVYTSAKKGFVRLFMSLFAFGASAAAAVFLTGLLAPPLVENWAGPGLERFITSRTSTALPDNATLDTLLSTADKVMSVVGGILGNESEEKEESAGTGKATTAATGTSRASGTTAATTKAGGGGSASAKGDEEEEKSGAQGLFHAVAFAIAGALVSFTLFAVIFSLVLAILRVMIDRLEFIDRIPIVGSLNTVLGVALGAVIGLVALMAPVWLLTNALPSLMDGKLTIPQDLLADSYVLHVLYYLYPAKLV